MKDRLSPGMEENAYRDWLSGRARALPGTFENSGLTNPKKWKSIFGASGQENLSISLERGEALDSGREHWLYLERSDGLLRVCYERISYDGKMPVSLLSVETRKSPGDEWDQEKSFMYSSQFIQSMEKALEDPVGKHLMALPSVSALFLASQLRGENEFNRLVKGSLTITDDQILVNNLRLIASDEETTLGSWERSVQ